MDFGRYTIASLSGHCIDDLKAFDALCVVERLERFGVVVNIADATGRPISRRELELMAGPTTMPIVEVARPTAR